MTHVVGIPAPRVSAETRTPYLDNVRFVAIFLVVAGHALYPVIDGATGRAAYLFIYAFHMPLFVIISGHLSKRLDVVRLVTTLLVPYLIFETAYTLATGNPVLTPTKPEWLTWYLLALLAWRFTTPLWPRLRHPLLVAVTACMVAGYFDVGADMALDRVFGLLPFFVLGTLIKAEHLERLGRPEARVAAVAVLALGVAAAPFLDQDWIYFRQGFDDWPGAVVRLGMLAVGVLLAAAVLALVPRGRTWFTGLGTRTIYIYLLHGFPVIVAKRMGWIDGLEAPLGVAAILAASLGLAVLLGSPITRWSAKPLVEPRLTWLLRSKAG